MDEQAYVITCDNTSYHFVSPQLIDNLVRETALARNRLLDRLAMQYRGKTAVLVEERAPDLAWVRHTLRHEPTGALIGKPVITRFNFTKPDIGVTVEYENTAEYEHEPMRHFQS